MSKLLPQIPPLVSLFQGLLVSVSCVLAQNALANPIQKTTLTTEVSTTSETFSNSNSQIEDSVNLSELSAVNASKTQENDANIFYSNCAKFNPTTNVIKPNISAASDEYEDSESFNLPNSSCAADLKALPAANFKKQKNASFSPSQKEQFTLSTASQKVAQTNAGDNPPEAIPESPTNSEETTATEAENNDNWHFEFQPYVTIPVTTYGNVTIKKRTVNYHVTTGQLLDLLRVTASGRVEAWKGNLGLIIDGYYVSLSGTGIKEFSRFGNVSLQSNLKFDQGIYDFAITYNFGNSPPHNLTDKPSDQAFPLIWFQPIAGVRLNDLNSTINTRVNFGRFEENLEETISAGRTWFEPLLGGKLAVQTSESLTLWMRGDASGFGMAGDTDLSWNLIAGLDWWVYRNISLQFAYRFYQINYGNGSGNNTFEFNESFNGPLLSATLHF